MAERVIEILTPQIFPALVIVLLILFYAYYIKILKPEAGTNEWIMMRKEADTRKLTLLNKRYPLEIKDIFPMLLIAAIFMSLSVFNLGSTNKIDINAEVEIWKEAAATEGRGKLSSGSNHMNNMYFDEVYNVRSAMEHMDGVYPYECTHPPLGKNLIAASILIFGESPFGWRMINTICGVLMILFMYAFIKNLFGKTTVAVCGSLLLGFEFMRVTQARIGTIDIFAVFFAFAAYYYMYMYITTDSDAKFNKSVIPLALSGLFFGLSISVKWIGFYAGAGLLVLYIIRLVQLFIYYSNNGKKGYLSYFMKTLVTAFCFFIVIPAIVYWLNYIPYGLAMGMKIENGMLVSREYFDVIWKNQNYMFNYHAYLTDGHDYGSRWWQWIINIRPTYYANFYQDGKRAAFGAFGNPVNYWGGLLAMIAMIIRVFTHRDGKALFIVTGYLINLLPWFAVTRVLFAYHYFTSSLFLILAIAYIFNIIFDRAKRLHRVHIYGYTALTGVVFALFYPSLSGLFMPQSYYSIFLKWLPDWPF